MHNLKFEYFAASDLPDVERIFRLAFTPSRFEVQLARSVLGENSKVEAHAWLVRTGPRAIAAALFTPATRDGHKIGYHLAPVAVQPESQAKGLASALITHALQQPPIREQAVFVLGAPSFYERFGFKPVRQVRCAFDPENRHFRALRWSDTVAPFTIGYDPAFGPTATSAPENY